MSDASREDEDQEDDDAKSDDSEERPRGKSSKHIRRGAASRHPRAIAPAVAIDKLRVELRAASVASATRTAASTSRLAAVSRAKMVAEARVRKIKAEADAAHAAAMRDALDNAKGQADKAQSKAVTTTIAECLVEKEAALSQAAAGAAQSEASRAKSASAAAGL